MPNGPFRSGNVTDPYGAFLLAVTLASNRMDPELYHLNRDVSGTLVYNRPWTKFLNNIQLQVAVPVANHLFSGQHPEFEALTEVLFREAILTGNTQLVHVILKRKCVDPNARLPGSPEVWRSSFNHYSQNPLEMAILKGDSTMTRILLEHGADLNAPICRTEEVIGFAMRTHSRAFVDILLSLNVDMKMLLPSFVQYGYIDMVQPALAQGANPNYYGPFYDHEKFESEIHTNLLGIATRLKNIGLIKTLVDSGADVNGRGVNNATNYDKDTPLYAAVESNAIEVVRLLLWKGADVNGNNYCPISALQLAVWHQFTEIAVLLLEAGASTEMPCHVSYHGGGRRVETLPTPLQSAAYHGDIGMASLLLRYGANPNANPIGPSHKDTYPVFDSIKVDGKSPLLLAIQAGNGCLDSNEKLSLVKLLLEAGATVNFPYVRDFSRQYISSCGDSTTPLIEAMKRHNQPVVDLLLSCGAVYSVYLPDRPEVCISALLYAAKIGDLPTVIRLHSAREDINALSPEDEIPLIAAIKGIKDHGSRSVIHYLLSARADTNHPGANHTALNAAVLQKDDELIELLLNNGSRPDDPYALKSAVSSKNHLVAKRLLHGTLNCEISESRWHKPCYGHSALFSAAEYSDIKMVQLILDGGIDPTVPCMTEVLRMCCESESGLPLLRLLLFAGVPVNLSYPLRICQCGIYAPRLRHDGDYWVLKSPLQYAVENRQHKSAQLLIDHGANVDDFHPDEYIDFWDSASLLVVGAIFHDDTIMTEILLSAGSTFTLPANREYGATALQAACSVGNMQIVERLMKASASVNESPAKDGGVTALQAAAIGGFLAIAIRLIEAGADVNASSAEKGGRTALEGAAERGRIDMVQLLLNAGAEVKDTEFGERQYENAITWAKEEGHNAVARLIERHCESLELSQFFHLDTPPEV